MAKNEWNVVLRKGGDEMHVANGYQSIFIGETDEHVPKESMKRTRTISYIIKDALNKKNPYPYERENIK